MRAPGHERNTGSWRGAGRWRTAGVLLVGVLNVLPACERGGDRPPSSRRAVVREALRGGPFPTLLVTQAQFDQVTDAGGKSRPVPGPAKLVLWRATPGGWRATVVEDEESNVFHKALPFAGGILTIGGTKAALKLWRFTGGAWSVETLWERSWGGKFDRLRDVEVGDVTGDGQDEIVLATHDQGVVAVGLHRAGGWKFLELDRAPGTFVHEIEIGDVDGDGRREFFATPSEPNRASGQSQPGTVVMYRWNGERFERTVVDRFSDTHAKEILAADLDGSGHATLLAVVEAAVSGSGAGARVLRPVEIRRYDFSHAGAPASTVVATIDDRQCRFLTYGDLDGDGAVELVAAAMRSGLWLIRPAASAPWQLRLIDADSSGFEHAAYAGDLDGDGTAELYVAADDQGELRVYRWDAKASEFAKEVIGPISKDEITWNITAGRF